jgi:hypothetical protein
MVGGAALGTAAAPKPDNPIKKMWKQRVVLNKYIIRRCNAYVLDVLRMVLYGFIHFVIDKFVNAALQIYHFLVCLQIGD